MSGRKARDQVRVCGHQKVDVLVTREITHRCVKPLEGREGQEHTDHDIVHRCYCGKRYLGEVHRGEEG